MCRNVLLLLMLLTLPGPPTASARDVLRERSSRVVEPAGLRGVKVENSHGDLRANPSADGKIHVTALKVVRSGSRAESERMASEIRVETTTESSQLVVRVHHPGRRSIRIGFWDLFHDFQVPSAEIFIVLDLPPGLALSASTSSGDLQTDGLQAGQDLSSTSGDMDVHSAGGMVRVTTSSGDVKLTQVGRTIVRTGSGDVDITSVHGPLDVHTSSGDLRIRDAADSLLLGTVSGDMVVEGAAAGLEATTTNGEIRVDRASGKVAIGTSSGSVELTMVPTVSEVSVTTGSGDIDLHLDRRVGALLELRTSNGTLQMDEPVQVLSLTRRRVTGQLRRGTAPVVLRSASGDIHVTTGEP